MNNQTAPTVRQGLLHGASGISRQDAASSKQEGLSLTAPPIKVGSPKWFAWLETHSAFRYESPAGSFSARKEVRSGNTYWYAYHKKQGKRVSTYIGKAEEMTATRLRNVTERLLRLESGAGEGSGVRRQGPVWPSRRPRLTSDPRPRTPAAELPGPDLAPPRPLPRPNTSLVDRVEEKAALLALLRRPDVRVVSLIGAGGIGKTRLAIEAMSELEDTFPDGVYFLTVDTERDPHSVLTKMAQLFGLSPDSHSSVAVLLAEALRGRRLLLVLDNLEQVPAAVPLLDELVSACPGPRLLVTTREVLHLRGEHHLLLGPLRFPNPAHLPPLQELLAYPAVELFIHRAYPGAGWGSLRSQVMGDEDRVSLSATAPTPNTTARYAGTRPSPEGTQHPNRRLAAGELATTAIEAIARICARLDGVPLAIELAAARVRLLSPEALLDRLDNRLAVLTGGGRDRPARHQTLRATLDWSYDLLSRDEQLVLRRLAVLSSRFDLDAAEAVCSAFGDLQSSILDILSSLIDKSLLLSTARGDNAPRLSLSETVREYALERLEESGELQAARDAHAEHYISLARQAGPRLFGEQQVDWLGRVDRDGPNFSAALTFLLSEQDYARSAELVGELGPYWFVRGRLSEGLSWAEQALYAPNGESAAPRNRRALIAAGLLAMHLDQDERAQDWLSESFELCKAARDTKGLARSAHLLSIFYLLKGNLAAALALAEEMSILDRGSADSWSLALMEYSSGVLAQYRGEFARARIHVERGAALFAEAGESHLRRLVLLSLADSLLATGERARAQVLLDEQIQAMESRRWGWTAGYMLCAHGRFAISTGDWSRARVLLEKALSLFDRLHDVRGVARASLFLAQAALYQQDYTAATMLARRCLANAQAVHARATVIGCLEELADVAIRRGKVAWAVQLWAAGERQRHSADPQQRPAPSVERAQLIAMAREALGEEQFVSTWDEGGEMPLEQLLSVENLASSMNKRPMKAPERPAGLTRRELDVLLLVARGLSNVEIAQQLVISPTTVVSYLNVIYRKLDVSSRTAAMRYVIDHQLT